MRGLMSLLLPRMGLWWRLAVAGCLVVSGLVHAQLYLADYRSLPVVGPSFQWQASASVAVGLLLLLSDQPLLRVLAAALAAGSLGGFALSRTVGFFGFVEQGWQPAPQAALAFVVEVAVLVVVVGFPILRRRRAARAVAV